MTNNSKQIGARMADGSVFAGMTADGKQQIYAMPGDLLLTMSFTAMRTYLKKVAASLTLSFALVTGVGADAAGSAPTTQTVSVQPRPFEGSECVKRPAGTEPVIADDGGCIEIGATMPDGSVFAGITADGKQRIYAMPDDLEVTTTFNDAAKAVETLNTKKSFGHDDWQIPSLEELRVLYKNRNKGALKQTFDTYSQGRGPDAPGWYWSSTEHRDYPSYGGVVRFSGGDETWIHRDDYPLSCRPVRLVAASAPTPAPR